MRWKDDLLKCNKRFRSLSKARMKAASIVCLLLVVVGFFFVYFHPYRSNNLLFVCYEGSRPFFNAVKQIDAGEESSYLFAGSLQQTKALAEGLRADAVCLSSKQELDSLAQKNHLLSEDWDQRLPFNASPFYSCIVFVANPSVAENIRDWEDLLTKDIKVSMPDPATSGAGRYAYLSLIYASQKDQISTEMRADWRKFFISLDLIPLSAPRAFSRFTIERKSDVFITWKSEAIRIRKGHKNYEIIYPSFSIKGEPVIAALDKYASERGTEDKAHKRLVSFFSPEKQKLAADLGFRPRIKSPDMELSQLFPPIELISIEEAFGSWGTVWEQHLGPKGSLVELISIKKALHGGEE